ncbi:hypothetical protein [Sphingobacterium multivorum]|uniref:hypothetical protein n=1 Tax=Sphingobacterium multivorum TaxID=28454 RepID=UPI0031BB183E
MNGRYFDQIAVLEKPGASNSNTFSGFAIMAIDCMIIETLQQFYHGIDKTPQSQSIRSFHNFFRRSPKLNSFFTNYPKSKIFYKQIRCGLLHQAQTKNRSVIHIRKEPVLAWIDDTDFNQGISIQRKHFHQEILSVFKKYCSDLRNPNEIGLRAKFRTKMGFIVK